MGIQAYLFGKNFKKDKKLENEREQIRHKLVDLNKRLYDLYQELTQEQDSFEEKRQQHKDKQEEMNSMKSEIESRLKSLEEVKVEIGCKFTNNTTSISEFKELCAMFITTHNDIEKTLIEVHQNEIEFEEYQQTWNEELLKNSDKTNNLRGEIETVLKEIARLNGCELSNS